jgi:hypothetical protein
MIQRHKMALKEVELLRIELKLKITVLQAGRNQELGILGDRCKSLFGNLADVPVERMY